jgi:hypothetical protein
LGALDGSKGRHERGRAAAIGGLAILLLMGAIAPARAHSITGFQWSNVDQLCTSGPCVSRGNLVGAWQAILWADGYLNKCGSSGVDGIFGSSTKSATKKWQSSKGLSADGVVGPMTWAVARGTLVYMGVQPTFAPGGKAATPVQYWDYKGKKHTVHFQYSSPIWAFRAPANPGQLPYYATSHPNIFFSRC